MNCKRFLELTETIKGDVCIFGAGDYGSTWCYELLNDAGLSIVCYVDNFKAGGYCNGLPIFSTDFIQRNRDVFVFVSTSGEPELKMVEQLRNLGVDNYFHFSSGYAPADFAQYLNELKEEMLIKKYPSIMDDEIYLKIYYKYRTGKELNLEEPKSFNGKLQWLKLFDRNPLYTQLSDKYSVKNYVASMIGEEHIIPTLFVCDAVDDIDEKQLPDQFVLKCTHDGGVIICTNRKEFDFARAKAELNARMQKNYFWQGREWCYKNIIPRIICEPYIVDESGYELKDYKVFCFDGEPKLIQIDFDRFRGHKRNLYTTDWKRIDAEIEYPSDSCVNIKRPAVLDKMLGYAAKLSEGFPHVRTDFYICDENIYLGEMTFYHGNGCEDYRPSSLGLELGEYINLNKAWVYRNANR